MGIIRCLMVLAAVIAASAYGGNAPVKITYASIGIGTYDCFRNSESGSALSKDSYFSSLKAEVYARILGWDASVSVPLALTLEIYDDAYRSRYALALSDLSASLGHKLGPVSPRLMIDIPLGYPTLDSVAWIGSGNVRVGLGLGYSLGSYVDGRLKLGGDLVVKICVSDTSHYARLGRGSTSAYAIVKASLAMNKRWGAGIELFPAFSYQVSTNWWPYEASHSLSVIPILSIKYNPVEWIDVAARGGYGYTWSGDHLRLRSATVIGGLSLGWCL